MDDAIQIATLVSVVIGIVVNAGILIKYFVRVEHRFTKLEVNVQHLQTSVNKKVVDSSNRDMM